MQRLISAFYNSIRAFRRLAGSETAFQQELLLLLVSLPVAWFVSTSWRGYALLVGAVLVLMLVEVLNTGIEATCDAVSREFNIDIQLAKDCGSLAVLLAVVALLTVFFLKEVPLGQRSGIEQRRELDDEADEILAPLVEDALAELEAGEHDEAGAAAMR